MRYLKILITNLGTWEEFINAFFKLGPEWNAADHAARKRALNK